MKGFVKKIIPDFILGFHRELHRKKRSRSYRGNNVVCPICNREFSSFIDFGHPKRKNVKCPYCGSLERHRLLWIYLNLELKVFSTEKVMNVLHFAPSYMIFKIFSKAANINYIPCDLFPGKYDFNSTVKIRKEDITGLTFGNDTFDMILCNHVLEHIPDDRLAMRELYRVMKPGGFGIFQVPINLELSETYEGPTITAPEDRVREFGQKDHLRVYGRDYVERLKNAGFSVKQVGYGENLSPDQIGRYRLDKNEILYLCAK